MDVIFLKSLRPLYCDYISRILCVRRPPLLYFYSRPYARGDQRSALQPFRRLYFYSRPYARGDSSYSHHHFAETPFLLPPLREGRLRAYHQAAAGDLHFYSRPYVRGDSVRTIKLPQETFISTRAPTRGTTSSALSIVVCSQFLLTPLREGRPKHQTENTESFVFLLTPLREGRPA